MRSLDRIGIVLPCKAEYVSVARLTASGIASRVGYDIETIEDIKVAVSEVCSRIINVTDGLDEQYEIRFDVYEDELVITFYSDNKSVRCIFDDDEDGLGMSIIRAFMDKVEYCSGNSDYILSMSKICGVISGNGI